MQDIEWIERYLDRSLKTDERRDMERRLQSDPELRSKYEEHRKLIDGIRLSHLHNKLEQLRTLERLLPAIEAPAAEGKQVFMRTYWKSMSAIAACIFFAVSGYVVFHDTTPINDQLYTAYYQPFDSPGPGLTRSQNEDVLTWKDKGYMAYDHGRYQEAIPAFENSLKEYNDPIIDLCLGNAYLSIGQPEKAEKVFQGILNDHKDLVTQAKWYLALAYLKQNKMDRVHATLWEIRQSSTYGEKAQKLLNELD